MESHGRPIEMKSDSNPICDLRDIPLGELATLVADGKVLAAMLRRLIERQEDPAAVSVTMFNSSI